MHIHVDTHAGSLEPLCHFVMQTCKRYVWQTVKTQVKHHITSQFIRVCFICKTKSNNFAQELEGILTFGLLIFAMIRPRLTVSYTVISCLFVVLSKLLPRGTVDDLMHHCTRPKAECNSASGRPRYRGVIV